MVPGRKDRGDGMKRREFLYGLAAGVAIATPVGAEGVVDSIVRQLKGLGFRTIVQERTLLGRVRIIATREDGQREIIVNPKTGEILRDLWTPVGGGPGAIAIIDDRSGKLKDDDDGNDDDDDDDDDEDNSGHGGGGDD
jgi:hypothetical protein